MKDKIFIAYPNCLINKYYPEYQSFYDDFTQKTKGFCKLATIDISDIWLRDFLPLQNIKTKEKFLFFYEPIYKTKEYKNLYMALRKEAKAKFPKATNLPIYLDGGNFIFNKKGTGILLKNKNLFKTKSCQEITKILKQKFSLKQIIYLPSLPVNYDPFCHIDGLIQFLGDDILCINSPYDKLTEKHLKKCLDILGNQFKIVFLPTEVNPKETLSAKGIYVNFLEVSKAVFMPKYNLHSDIKAQKIIQKYTKKPVIKIDCSKIAKYGGSLHCLTQNYIF